MFRAIGVVIILYALSRFFTASFSAFDSATAAVFSTVETAATISTERIEAFEEK